MVCFFFVGGSADFIVMGAGKFLKGFFEGRGGSFLFQAGNHKMIIESKFMFLGSWVFWASGTFRHFQPFSENIFRHLQTRSVKIRHFQAFSWGMIFA